LGDQFVKEVTETILKIEYDPDRYPIKYKNYRQTSIDTFPFLIIFKTNERNKLVRIVSVFHTSRHPDKKYWVKAFFDKPVFQKLFIDFIVIFQILFPAPPAYLLFVSCKWLYETIRC
jgi:hypothetical protein